MFVDKSSNLYHGISDSQNICLKIDMSEKSNTVVRVL